MAYEIKVTRRVEFADTDMAGIMHFANFFHFMETAEQAFFRSLGFSIAPASACLGVGWPRVHAKCDFKKPLQFEDQVEIHLLVVQKRNKVLTYEFRFRKLNASPPVEVARGCVTVVCVRNGGDGSMHATALPKEIADQIDEAPAALLR